MTAAGEVILVAVGSKTGGVPEANRVLDVEFVLERAKTLCAVKGQSSTAPFTPPRLFGRSKRTRDPDNFWDPTGFTADGNQEKLAHNRQTELKHGLRHVQPKRTQHQLPHLTICATLQYARHFKLSWLP
jgi:hypothetical protein